MPTVCIQCALAALVKGEPAPTFDESPEAHQQRVHPDPAKTREERIALEQAWLHRYHTEKGPSQR